MRIEYLKDKDRWKVRELIDDETQTYLKNMLNSERMKFYIEESGWVSVERFYEAILDIPVYLTNSDSESIEGIFVSMGGLVAYISLEVIIDAMDAIRHGVGYKDDEWDREYNNYFKRSFFHEIMHAIRSFAEIPSKKTYKSKGERDNYYKTDDLRMLPHHVNLPFHQTFWHDYFLSQTEFYTMAEEIKYMIEILGYSPEEAKQLMAKRVAISPHRERALQYIDKMLWATYAPTVWEGQEEAGQQRLFANKVNWYKIAQTETPKENDQLLYIECWIDPNGKIYCMKPSQSHVHWVKQYKEYLDNTYNIIWDDNLNRSLLIAGWIRTKYDPNPQSLTWFFEVDKLSNDSAIRLIGDKLLETLPKNSSLIIWITEEKVGYQAKFRWNDFINSGVSFLEYVRHARENACFTM